MNKQLATALFAALTLSLAPLAAKADILTTYNLTYTATDGGNGYTTGTTTGTGSFTVDSNNPAGIDDVTAFTFTVTENCSVDQCGTTGDVDTFTWTLSDLQNFSATFSGSTVTDLSFYTDNQGGFYTPSQFLQVNSLGLGGAYTANFDVPGKITSGQVTATLANPIAPTPEPSSLGLLTLGLGSIAGLRTRFKRAA